MVWKKGESGNINGRPKGAVGRSTEIRNAIADNADALVAKVVQMALDGDSTALRICIKRLCPALRPKDAPVVLAMSANGPLEDQGRAILSEMAKGIITPTEANTLLGALASQAKLIESDELTRRVEALEAKQ